MPEIKKLYTQAEINQTDKGLVAIASTAVEDRHGEVVEVEGWDLKNYKKNPVILWAHDHTKMPVGATKKTWIEGTGKKAKLMFEPIFHEVTSTARAIKRLVELGILKSFSVGFRPIDQDGDTFTKQELLEISVVNVPANADAMMLAYKSLSQDGFKDQTIQDLGIPIGVMEKLGAIEEKQKLMQGKLDAAVKGLTSLNSQSGRSQRAIEEGITMSKIVVKAADLLNTRPPVHKQARLVKAIKLAGEQLIVSQKNELNNGTNKRT